MPVKGPFLYLRHALVPRRDVLARRRAGALWRVVVQQRTVAHVLWGITGRKRHGECGGRRVRLPTSVGDGGRCWLGEEETKHLGGDLGRHREAC